MDRKNCLYTIIIVLIVLVIIIFGIDLYRLIKISTSYISTTTENRISNKDVMKSIKYASTDNEVEYKNDIFEKLKEYNDSLIASKEVVNDIFEIKNIHKIKDYYMEYKKYFIVKYKLFNLIEDIPDLANRTKNMTDVQIKQYFNDNFKHIENIYGITDVNEFLNFCKSLSFFNNSKVSAASVKISSIVNDAENFTLMFKLMLFNNNNEVNEYHINSNYYKTTDNQISPYIDISIIQKFE